MSEAALTKIQKDVSISLYSLQIEVDDVVSQCAKLEGELAVFKNSQPISTSCEA